MSMFSDINTITFNFTWCYNEEGFGHCLTRNVNSCKLIVLGDMIYVPLYDKGIQQFVEDKSYFDYVEPIHWYDLLLTILQCPFLFAGWC